MTDYQWIDVTAEMASIQKGIVYLHARAKVNGDNQRC